MRVRAASSHCRLPVSFATSISGTLLSAIFPASSVLSGVVVHPGWHRGLVHHADRLRPSTNGEIRSHRTAGVTPVVVGRGSTVTARCDGPVTAPSPDEHGRRTGLP